MTDTQFIVQKLWNYCNILRDDGLSYGDYVEQLTFLLFLKMAAERVEFGLDKNSAVPEAYNWQSLLDCEERDLDSHYRKILEELGKSPQDERLRVIFSKAQNKIQDPAKLRRLIVDLIDKENWLQLKADVKGDAYEGLLQKNAEDTKGGAGQYFTPRPLIQAILAVMSPRPDTRICDPACGTGGFLLAAFEFITKHYDLDVEQRRKLENQNLRGIELVDSVARLCLMNMVLHGIGGDNVPIERKDSLEKKPSEHFDMVLTNPPFGKKSAVTIINKEGKQSKESLTVERKDFWTSTSNKQLNFLQHVYTMLNQDGRAAVVVPDNVLFEGGAGETVRENLLQLCDVHTLLRLPTGIFYAQGVKANVIFFDCKKGEETAATSKLWIYDFRTNQNFTLKERPLKYEDLLDFIQCYNPENRFERQPTRTEENPQGRWDYRSYEELIGRDKTNLDIFWLKDDSLKDDIEEPDIIAKRMEQDLRNALEKIELIYQDLKGVQI